MVLKSVRSFILIQLVITLANSPVLAEAAGGAGCLVYYGDGNAVCLPPQTNDICLRTDIDVDATFGSFVGSLCTAQKTQSGELQTTASQVAACQADEQKAKAAADAAEGTAAACLNADPALTAGLGDEQKAKDKVVKNFQQLQSLLKKLCKGRKGKNKCPKYDDKLPISGGNGGGTGGGGTSDPFLGIWAGVYFSGGWYTRGLTFLSSTEVYEGIAPLGRTNFTCSSAPKDKDGKPLQRCGRYSKTDKSVTITWAGGETASYAIEREKDGGMADLLEQGKKSCSIGETDYACIFQKAEEAKASFLANATWGSRWSERIPGNPYIPGSGGSYSGGKWMTLTADGRFEATQYSSGSINFGTGSDPTGYNPGIGIVNRDRTAGRWEIVDRYTLRLHHDTGETTQHTFFGNEWPAGEATPQYLYLEGYGVTRMYCRSQYC